MHFIEGAVRLAAPPRVEAAAGRPTGPVPVTMSRSPRLLTHLTARAVPVVPAAAGVWSSDAVTSRR
jgi:hypothetical protein